MLFLAAPPQSAAQAPFRIDGEPEILIDLPDASAMNARWSRALGSPLIAYTTDNYRGLWITNTETGTSRQLTAERAAGFGYRWSSDGSAILTREARFEGTRRQDALTVFAADSAASFQLSTVTARTRSLPEWTSANEAIVVFDDRSAQRIPNPMVARKTGIGSSESYTALDGSVLRIGPDGSRQELVSFDSHVLNLSVSPDRRYLAFEVLGGDLYVTRSDGSALVSLGRGNRPEWSPNSRYIVFMRTTDDGHDITSSELVIGSTVGRTWQLTATGNVHEMNPSWSADGRRISYDFDGRVYALSIKEN